MFAQVTANSALEACA